MSETADRGKNSFSDIESRAIIEWQERIRALRASVDPLLDEAKNEIRIENEAMVGAARLAQMEQSLDSALEALSSSNIYVQLVALDVLMTTWDYPPLSMLSVILLATATGNSCLRLTAIEYLGGFAYWHRDPNPVVAPLRSILFDASESAQLRYCAYCSLCEAYSKHYQLLQDTDNLLDHIDWDFVNSLGE